MKRVYSKKEVPSLTKQKQYIRQLFLLSIDRGYSHKRFLIAKRFYDIYKQTGGKMKFEEIVGGK